MQRTLKRELKVRETVEREADETTAGLYLSVSLGILSFRVRPWRLEITWARAAIPLKVVCVVSRSALAG